MMDNNKQVTFLKAMSFAIQFGFMIVLPLLVFAYAGKWLAAKYDNQIFLFAGILLALLTTIVWFYTRISSIYKEFLDKK